MVLMHPGLKNGPFLPHNVIPDQEIPVSLLKFHMTPRLKLLIYFGSKQREPRYTCLRAARDAHSQRMCAKISSSAPHLLHKGLLVSHKE